MYRRGPPPSKKEGENTPRRPQVRSLVEILKVAVLVMVGPAAHKRSTAAWKLCQERSYTNTAIVLGNWHIRNVLF